MEFLVHFQSFKNYSNDFIVKKLCIITTELHLFQPTFDFKLLPNNI